MIEIKKFMFSEAGLPRVTIIKSQAPCPGTPLTPKNPRTGKIIKIVLLMSAASPAHTINLGVQSRWASIVKYYITFACA